MEVVRAEPAVAAATVEGEQKAAAEDAPTTSLFLFPNPDPRRHSPVSSSSLFSSLPESRSGLFRSSLTSYRLQLQASKTRPLPDPSSSIDHFPSTTFPLYSPLSINSVPLPVRPLPVFPHLLPATAPSLYHWCCYSTNLRTSTSESRCEIFLGCCFSSLLPKLILSIEGIITRNLSIAIVLLIEQFHLTEVIRASVPKLNLDDAFEQKNDIAKAVEDELEKAMSAYGYEIVQTLIVDIEPDEHVKRAMNEINAGSKAAFRVSRIRWQPEEERIWARLYPERHIGFCIQYSCCCCWCCICCWY